MRSRTEAPATAFRPFDVLRAVPSSVEGRLKPEATPTPYGEATPTPDGWLPALAGRIVAVAMAAISLVGAAGCRQDMHNQPKYRGLRGTPFFTDGGSARPLVEGTVARGTLQDDAAFYTGKVGTATVKELPFPVDEAVLNRGQERFNIFCTPCHDATGSGKGLVIQRGFKAPPSFHDERLRNADAGYFFDVMTNGFGAMSDYRMQLTARDRWSVVAYIRALQLSQRAPASDVPGGDPTKAQPAPPQPGPAKH
jgi:mono/diheme cytochrome c family protein